MGRHYSLQLRVPIVVLDQKKGRIRDIDGALAADMVPSACFEMPRAGHVCFRIVACRSQAVGAVLAERYLTGPVLPRLVSPSRNGAYLGFIESPNGLTGCHDSRARACNADYADGPRSPPAIPVYGLWPSAMRLASGFWHQHPAFRAKGL